MAKYDPLERYLSRKTASEIEMTFVHIERVIGAMLPNSAARPQWWANEVDPESRHVQTHTWRNAGYDAFLIADAEKVCFKRRDR